MTDKVDITALAKLARLEVSEAEMIKLEKEIPDILHFVETIQKADTGKKVVSPTLRNVMRSDDNPIESGTFTKVLLETAPAREGDRIAVKQVISRNKKS